MMDGKRVGLGEGLAVALGLDSRRLVACFRSAYTGSTSEVARHNILYKCILHIVHAYCTRMLPVYIVQYRRSRSIWSISLLWASGEGILYTVCCVCILHTCILSVHGFVTTRTHIRDSYTACSATITPTVGSQIYGQCLLCF